MDRSKASGLAGEPTRGFVPGDALRRFRLLLERQTVAKSLTIAWP
jgi:hypothetical protein